MRKLFYCSAFMCLLFSACNSPKTSENATMDMSRHLQFEEVHFQPYQTTYITVGTVKAKSGCLAEIGLPLSGRVSESCVHLGEKVHKGSPLFSIQSPEIADQIKAYFQAESTEELCRKSLERKRSLVTIGGISQREIEEAENAYELAHRELNQWENTLKAYGLDITRLQSSGSLTICSPINGEVVEMNLTSGQYVQSDSPSLMTIADLSTIWIAARLKEYYMDCVHESDSVEVLLNTISGYHTTGKVVYIGQLLDEATRSVEVIVECSNKDHNFKPGMFAHVHFTAAETQALQIPASSVMQGNEHTYVYVVNNQGNYAKRDVEVETSDEGKVRVLSGLEAGEKIVSEGGIYLNK